jgi:hypothetical protein
MDIHWKQRATSLQSAHLNCEEEMMRIASVTSAAVGLSLLCFLTVSCTAPPATAQESPMSFFITSVGPGNGADLGGLAGADAHCEKLAAAAGAGGRQWRAYLSTGGSERVNARDRIGTGPWHNAKGMQVADSIADLHSSNNRLSKETALSEKGEVISGRGDTPNRHDILTGSQADGTAFSDAEDHTCSNWTGSTDGSAQVGHHDRQGGGSDPTSWNSAHGSRGCSQENLRASGGDGLFYCFAVK